MSIGDGLLFKGSQGVAEALAAACLTSIPMVSAYAASLLCCDSGAPGALEQSFKVLSALAAVEALLPQSRILHFINRNSSLCLLY